jgi:hypothetical protein
MYSRYNKDKTYLSSKTPTCLIYKTLTFMLYDLINHPNIMGARCSCSQYIKGVHNTVADAIFQLEYAPNLNKTNEYTHAMLGVEPEDFEHATMEIVCAPLA